MKRSVAIIILLCLKCIALRAEDTRFIRGIVRDSITDVALANASVMIENSTKGAITDADGIFELSIPSSARFMTVSNLGYAKKTVPVNNSSLNLYAIYMTPAPEELQEVTVRKSAYSKKNNPAVEFARRLKEQGKLSDPRRNRYYNYRKYQRTAIALNEFDTIRYAAY
ncbi:MAG: carboxypeptidase-like regulatory domain-containing protein, partial [Muribaculaceae bacterium]|nr:carboxypeptidase-like regulatory domain-containing protein [Muribaculaceae bacterium]